MPRPEVGSISREFLTQTRSIKASVTDQRDSIIQEEILVKRERR